ncbi:MAG: methyltransferase domain-containing protein [Candidatus Paceibacterota bacterium]|jgi:SAM-dependent methyltransferase
MVDKKDWSEYYDFTRAQPPRELLVEALSYVKDTGKVIDIGGGALRDTKLLLQKGYDVTVIDRSPLLEKEAKEIKSDKLHTIVTTFEDFQFPVDEYILASAMYSLPHCEPEHFSQVITNIKASLKKGGIFCGQMFGDHDQWSKTVHMTYLTVDKAKEYLKDMETILFREVETKEGETKHWHIYNFIARKM